MNASPCAQCMNYQKHYVKMADYRYKASEYGHCIVYRKTRKACPHFEPNLEPKPSDKMEVKAKLESLIAKIEELYAYINSK